MIDYKCLGIPRGIFSKYQSKILSIDCDTKKVKFYDQAKDKIRTGKITEVEDDELYIKADDTGEEICWPIDRSGKND